MTDHHAPPDHPVRAAVRRFLAGWEQAWAGGPKPAVADFLADVPEPDRAAVRSALEALDRWARAVFAAADRTAAHVPAEENGATRTFAGLLSSGPPTGDVTSAAGPPAGDDGPTATFGLAAGGVVPGGHLPGYELLGLLGRGGMGVVYKARHLRLDRVVAVKWVVRAGGASARDRLDAEARAVAKLQHPHIVQVFEVGEADGLPYFTLEYVPGGTLAQRVPATCSRRGRRPSCWRPWPGRSSTPTTTTSSTAT